MFYRFLIALLTRTFFLQFIIRIASKLLPNPQIDINRTEIIEYVKSEGRMTSRFSFMTIVSCGVATMGLLQSSPAVVIGAMLISPLMSPIMALGFGLCIMDFKMLKKSLEALVIGTVMALLISYTLVSLSPLNDPTPEIMARTSPNLLDLGIAVFSALAGGYSIIKRKGETLVGVAIATALMPPLAVVGYGLATGKSEIAIGSFFLFMTNLLAIALTVTLIAIWYGFGHRHGKHYGKWQVALVTIVFALLSIPLGSSLKQIAYQTLTTRTARSIINDYFAKEGSPTRIEQFHIGFPQNDEIHVDTVILTKKYNTKAKEEILASMQTALGGKVSFSIDQLVVSQDPTLASALTLQTTQNTLAAPVNMVQQTTGKSLDSITQLREALPIPADVAPVADTPSAFIIHPKPIKGGAVGIFRKMEQELLGRFDGLDIKIVPPVSRLPDIYFATGHEQPDASGEEALKDCLWALARWGISEVQVVGFASTVGEQEAFDNKSLAFRRAKNVANQLESAGIHPVIKAEYQTYEQRQLEKHTGMNDFQKVELRLIHTDDNTPITKETP